MASLVISVSTIGNGIATLALTRIVRSSFSTCSGYTSTPSRFDNRSVPLSLQRVEAELDALATCQQQGSRDIKELREDIKAIKEDLNVLLTSTRASCNSRMKIPPQLSV